MGKREGSPPDQLKNDQISQSESLHQIFIPSLDRSYSPPIITIVTWDETLKSKQVSWKF